MLLVWLVYIMGAALVVLFIGLMVGVIYKATHRSPAEVKPATVLDLGIAAGELRSTELDGDRLVITTAQEIIIVDARQGRVMLKLPLK